MIRVHVDHERCCGYGFCVRVAPNEFALDDQGKAVATAEEMPDDKADLLKRAARTCPQSAIVVSDG